jgi:3'(2'), 5'-bisphosphate nucleotidase
MPHFQDELRVAIDLARAAGAAILEQYKGPLHVQQKNLDDDLEPVTQADRIANELIVMGLQREFPHDGILAEESIDTARRLRKSRVWMVDPLDGTNGFIDGNGDFAVQIGLVEDGEVVVGVVYQPLPGVLYRAVRGEGTWIERPQMEPERAQTSDATDLPNMRLAASRSHRSPRMNKVVQRFGFREEVQRGSVGIKVGLIIEQQWDTCAPQLILTEAGGQMSDLFGSPLNYNVPDVQNRNGLVASNGASHDRIIATLAPLLAEFGRKQV